jgi:hypothetical protein
MERPGWSEMVIIFWVKCFLLILWHSSISVWIILIISGLFFRKSLRYHRLYSLIYGKHFEVRRIDLFYDKVIFSPFFTMIMFRLSVINPSISLSGYWFIVKRLFLWQSDYWRSKLISYTVASHHSTADHQ